MAKTTKKSGGARKYGRQKRKPSHMRYNNEDRRFKNKLKRKWHFQWTRAGD